MLVHYLSDDQSQHIAEIHETLRQKLRDFIVTSFLHHGRKLFDAYFSGMTMGMVTSSISEIYHRATKKAVDGPRPNHDVHECATALNHCENRRNALKGKRAAYDATSTVGKAQDRKKIVDQLTSECNKKLGPQNEDQKNICNTGSPTTPSCPKETTRSTTLLRKKTWITSRLGARHSWTRPMSPKLVSRNRKRRSSMILSRKKWGQHEAT